MTFTTTQLAEYVGGSLVGDSQVMCNGGSIDTRNCSSGNVFFALDGEHSDGHQFIEQAALAGCSAVVVEHEVKTSLPQVIVDDSRRALYDLAMERRKVLPAKKVIAITGSVGKTTTKELIAFLIGDDVVASKKSFNNDLGVPLTILAAERATYLVAEIGINDIGEIDPLAQLVKPDIAILTSIDNAHLEGLKDIATVLSEKVKLLEALPSDGLAILPDSIDLSDFDIIANVCRIGFRDSSDIQIGIHVDSDGAVLLEIGEHSATLAMLGAHNAWNAALAVVACMNICPDIECEEWMKRISAFESLAGRLRVHEINGIRVIDDSYNANPASMRSALETFATLQSSRKVLVLGDMLELGESAHAEHRLLASVIESANADLVVLVGEQMGVTAQTVCSVYEPAPTEEAMRRIAELFQSGDTVMLKGSRGIALERILHLLPQTKVSTL